MRKDAWLRLRFFRGKRWGGYPYLKVDERSRGSPPLAVGTDLHSKTWGHSFVKARNFSFPLRST